MLDTLLAAGLAQSEAKVYLALLERGNLTKTPLVKHAQISPSKVYEVVEKLKQKGLVSVVTHNGVQTFSAAPPLKIKEYLQRKQQRLTLAEDGVEKILPKLLALSASANTVDINVFSGWEGISATIMQLATQLKPKSILCSIGASPGREESRTQQFFGKYVDLLKRKKIKIRVLFKADARAYAQTFITEYPPDFAEYRYLFKQSVAEVTVAKDTVLIMCLEKEPFVIRIINEQVADLFKQYFAELWKVAEE